MDSLYAFIGRFIPDVMVTVPYVGIVDMTPFLLSAGVFAVLSVLFKVVLVVVLGRLRVLSQKTNTDIDDVIIDAIEGVRAWVYTLVALYIAIVPFTLPETVQKVFTAVVLAAIVWQLIEVALCFISYGTQRLVEKDADGDGQIDPNAATASDMIKLIARIVLWVFGAIFVLSNLGIEVTSLIAGLGIGGIAVAFALQGVLSDLFASFSIYFDKPFRIGDFITIGTESGTVEKIGIKTTRLRTLQGEELVVSNAELTTARVQNFKRMEERRGAVQFGITYETPFEKVQAINGMVEKIFADIENARLDRVFFTTFGDSALIFDVVFYVNSPAYPDFLVVQQQYNHALMQKFAAEGIEFAYPTQTVFHKEMS